MRKSFLILLMICSSIMSCDDDEDAMPLGPDPVPVDNPDTDKAGAFITLPANDAMLLFIEWVEINARVKSDKAIKEIRFYMISPDAPNRQVKISDIHLRTSNKKEQFSHRFRLPKNSALGDYTVFVEAKDESQKIMKDSVTFTVHAPTLNQAAFSKAFLGVNIYSIMDWSGYSFGDEAGLTIPGLNFWFALMIDRDWDREISAAEWNRFAADFNLKNQSLSEWDVNRDGKLRRVEFDVALNELAFFKKWDVNEDELVEDTEMAIGFFESWDHNKDGLLAQEEYLDRFYTYCLLD